jgi:hypothetical protein
MAWRWRWWSTLAVLAVQLGACQDRGESLSGAGEVVTSEAPSMTGLKIVLRQRLDQEGLTEEDLAAHPATAEAFGAWQAAARAGDEAAARGPHQVLLQHLSALGADPAVLTQKLARVQARLTEKGEQLPEARRAALSEHVASLAAKLAAPTPDRASVGLALSVVERQLRNLD